MNMYGIMTPEGEVEHDRRSVPRRAIDWMREQRTFMLVVVAPLLLLAGYYYLIAADQYESESHFLVKSSQQTMGPISGFGQMLGLSASGAQSEAMSVSDYLTSHDVVEDLRKRVGLVAMFRRPEADFFSRLWTDDPAPERLLRYFRSHVEVHIDQETGITTLVTRGFRRDDSFRLNRALLELGEQRVNEMNLRSYNDAVKMARAQLAEAENNVAVVQGNMTRYRETRSDIDPQVTGETQIRMVGDLRRSLTAARAQHASLGTLLSPSSPQYVALAARVRALEGEIAAQDTRLAGTGRGGGEEAGGSIATSLGGFENLKVRQEFAAKRYEGAAANLEKAREDALRQQLYVVRVVDANMPGKSLYPKRIKVLMVAALILLLIYAIGWLLVAGVHEHTA